MENLESNTDGATRSQAYEATWAPKDPRDRLYDEGASTKEKAASVYRVVSSFHPVLNMVVLAFDSFRRFGLMKTFMIALGILGAFYGLFMWKNGM
jgi:hypothetical protein